MLALRAPSRHPSGLQDDRFLRCAEFDSYIPYFFYSTYEEENERSRVRPGTYKKKVIVLGSGPIRIGQGVEFDYSTVHAVWASNRRGYETIIVNNNPETVSTDFDIADKLYFEPLTREDVGNIVDLESRTASWCSSAGRRRSS